MKFNCPNCNGKPVAYEVSTKSDDASAIEIKFKCKECNTRYEKSYGIITSGTTIIEEQ